MFKGLSHDACYELHTDATDFDLAEYTCAKKGGHLTSVGSAFANRFIRRLAENVTADRLWIGGHYGGENEFGSFWMWNDETEWTYDNWKYSGPLCRSCWSSSLQFERSTGKWYDGNSTDALPFVCLIELKPEDTPCANGWTYNPNTKLCYTVIDYQNGYTWTWSGAQYECKHNNASLVTIPDLATNYDILRIQAGLVSDVCDVQT
ncbi:Protein CLEC-52 [Aphelenchoides avenae]|nr:Protein CLEC-52 [Aphelenchus avenae]